MIDIDWLISPRIDVLRFFPPIKDDHKKIRIYINGLTQFLKSQNLTKAIPIFDKMQYIALATLTKEKLAKKKVNKETAGSVLQAIKRIQWQRFTLQSIKEDLQINANPEQTLNKLLKLLPDETVAMVGLASGLCVEILESIQPLLRFIQCPTNRMFSRGKFVRLCTYGERNESFTIEQACILFKMRSKVYNDSLKNIGPPRHRRAAKRALARIEEEEEQ